jgi:hypothetical protein
MGYGYSVGTTFSINYDFGGGGIPTIFTVNSINNGEIISASIVEGGLGYAVGDIVRVNSGEESKIIADITGSVTRLPSSYKIEKNFNNGLLRLNDILLPKLVLHQVVDSLQLEQIIDMDIYTLQSLQGLN